jgi:6-phosphogluconolactonase (cycloisomerase 2 family)
VAALLAFLVGCGNSNKTNTTPGFVVAADSINGNNIEIFSVNQTSSALTAISGSPYNFSLAGPDGSIVTHPNGKWVYVCDWSSTNLIGLSIDQTAGTPTAIGSTVNTTGGCDWSSSMAITPAGKYIYTADDDDNISSFSVNSSTGALTQVGTPATVSGSAWVITATDSYVYAGGDGSQNIYIMKINSDGSLGTPTTFAAGVGTESLAIDRSQKFLVIGGTSGVGFAGYSINADGSLTSLGSPVVPSGVSWVDQIVFSGDNKFMYASDEGVGVRAFSFNPSTGAIAELAGSPYATSNSGSDSVAMDPTGKFVYADDSCSNVYSWVRDTTAGTLSSGTPTTTAGDAVCQLTVTWK